MKSLKFNQGQRDFELTVEGKFPHNMRMARVSFFAQIKRARLTNLKIACCNITRGGCGIHETKIKVFIGVYCVVFEVKVISNNICESSEKLIQKLHKCSIKTNVNCNTLFCMNESLDFGIFVLTSEQQMCNHFFESDVIWSALSAQIHCHQASVQWLQDLKKEIQIFLPLLFLLMVKHDLRPILTCCTRNSATQKPSATATLHNLLIWWQQLATATLLYRST